MSYLKFDKTVTFAEGASNQPFGSLSLHYCCWIVILRKYHGLLRYARACD